MRGERTAATLATPLSEPTLRLPPRLLSIVAAALALSCSAAPAPRRGPAPEMQLSLSGYENAVDPARGDRADTVYVLSGEDTLKYFTGKGIHTFRLPMNWNRLQPRIGGPLDAAKLAELETFLDRADSFDARVIADLHMFGRRDGTAIGAPGLPPSALVSFWTQFAKRFRGRFAGYDIMNEPHDMPDRKVWPETAQATVDSIRTIDRDTAIYVEGDDWSNAGSWQQSNGDLAIHDPSNRIIYSAHVYFDHDNSGQYRTDYDSDGATPSIGADRLKPFEAWLRKNGYKGQIGEFGGPIDDPRWLAVLDGFLTEARGNGDVLTGVAYWMAGDWADQYPLTLQPAKDGKWIDRPQLQTLLKSR